MLSTIWSSYGTQWDRKLVLRIRFSYKMLVDLHIGLLLCVLLFWCMIKMRKWIKLMQWNEMMILCILCDKISRTCCVFWCKITTRNRAISNVETDVGNQNVAKNYLYQCRQCGDGFGEQARYHNRIMFPDAISELNISLGLY